MIVIKGKSRQICKGKVHLIRYKWKTNPSFSYIPTIICRFVQGLLAFYCRGQDLSEHNDLRVIIWRHAYNIKIDLRNDCFNFQIYRRLNWYYVFANSVIRVADYIMFANISNICSISDKLENWNSHFT
jgi:hypothetical protein